MIKYSRFNEQMEHYTLGNGLGVNLILRPLFHQTYGILTTRFGSVNTQIDDQGSKKKYPAGIAHFLEHKLFEKEDYDAFDKFAIYGADTNAFTTFTRTSFLFSTADNVSACVSTLLSFVYEPYFSSQTVDKEKGIIGQEIQMYSDDPNWQLLFGVICNLYPNSPLAKDIAGDNNSIQKITPELLYDCYHSFYYPENMNLLLIGNFDIEQIKQVVDDSTKKTYQMAFTPVHQEMNFTNHKSVIPFGKKFMDVQRPKVALGVRIDHSFDQAERFRAKIMLQLILEMLFGESSNDYQRLYDTGIIDNSFGYEIQLEDGFQFVDFYLDTNAPKQAIDELKKIIVNSSAKLANEQSLFELMKREFIGRAIKEMNSNENIANQFDNWLFGEKTLFDVPIIIEQIQLDDLVEFTKLYYRESQITEYQILPKEVDV